MAQEFGAGDWATFAAALDMAEKVARELEERARAQPIGDLSMYDGYPHLVEYITRAHAAPGRVLAQYATPVCPECSTRIEGAGVITGEHDVHYVLAGSVIVGCEDYDTINPAALGLDGGQWHDWRSDDYGRDY